MKVEDTNTKFKKKINTQSLYSPVQSFEVAVIDDNKLINLVLTKTLNSTINRLRSLKKISIKFSSFGSGTDFLYYLRKKEVGNSKFIVFSDYYLEEEVNGAEILKYIKEKENDATVIIMSDTTNKQTSVDTINMGAHCFLPNDSQTPSICTNILTQMVI